VKNLKEECFARPSVEGVEGEARSVRGEAVHLATHPFLERYYRKECQLYILQHHLDAYNIHE
jgi:hypothetical protein